MRFLQVCLLMVGQLLSCAGFGMEDVTLRCGTLLDVSEEVIRRNQQITVKGDRITYVGPASSIEADTAEIDLLSSVCMPGLMDMHIHLFVDTTERTLDESAPTRSSAFNTISGLVKLETLIQRGITTIRTPGDFDYYYAGIELRNAVRRLDIPGPEMFVAPHPMSATGGHADLNTYSPDFPHEVAGPMIVNGPTQIREAVRREIKYGADWIKVMVTGGIMSQGDDPSVTSFDDEELVAFVEETHRHNRKISAHAIGDKGVEAAVKAGFDAVEHAILADRQTLELMAEKGTYYVPTVYVLRWILEKGASGGVSADNLRKAREVAAKHAVTVRLAYEAGVKMVVGSDSIFPVEQSLQEYVAMADVLQDNWYVLRAGTVHASEMLGVSHQVGILKAGARADIVATKHNPIDDMTNLEGVHFVMKHGKVMRHD